MLKIRVNDLSFEITETATIKSEGLEHVVDFRRFTEEGWRVYLNKGLRYFTDGAPLIPKATTDAAGNTIEPDAEAVDKAKALRQKKVDEKIGAICGERPIREGRTSDPVAAVLKVYVRGWLQKKGGFTAEQAKLRLGNTTDEVLAKAKACGAPASWLKRAVALAEADVERSRAAKEGLGI